MKERLAKFISECGVASRRKAEELIENGHVYVNSKQIVTPVYFVNEDDKIIVDGVLLKRPDDVKLYMFNKPLNTMTTTNDPEGRKTIYDYLEKQYKHLKYVGRLDYKTTGLLLLTNSGDLARKLSLPKNHIPRTYIVKVNNYTEDGLKVISKGTKVEGIYYRPMKVKPIDKNTLRVTVDEGKKNEIRIVFKSIGSPVVELHRINFGNIELGNLAPKKIKEIPKKTIDLLLKNF